MDNIKKENYNSKADFDIKSQILFIYSFWPYILVSLIISLAIAYTYLRYTNYEFKSYSRIEIIDKAQDSEMALPTEMTVFNRSMINLENEIGVLSSYRLHEKVVQSLNSNVKFYTKGFIKVSEDHHSEWWSGLDYDLNFKIELDTITELKSYEFSINDNGNLKINRI